jgi:hypothetical protein
MDGIPDSVGNLYGGENTVDYLTSEKEESHMPSIAPLDHWPVLR